MRRKRLCQVEHWNGTLTEAERQALQAQLAQTQDAALYRRVLALLELDRGQSVAEAARLLHVDRRSIYRWRERFARRREAAALTHQAGQGRWPHWNGELASVVESALEQPPVQLGYPANTWTAPLLQAFLSFHFPEPPLSLSTLRRHLKELGLVWKRPRHVLAPDPEAEKKTPPLASDPGAACAHRAVGAG